MYPKRACSNAHAGDQARRKENAPLSVVNAARIAHAATANTARIDNRTAQEQEEHHPHRGGSVGHRGS